MQTKDYFIKDSGISAYTINAFVEAIVEATKAGQSIDYNSARRIGMSFSLSFAQTQEETSIETQAPAQEEAPESPAQPEASAEEPSEQSGGQSEQSKTIVGFDDGEGSGHTIEVPFTAEDIENAKNSMVELNKLAEPVGLSARSKKELVKLLKEYIGA